MSYTWLWTLFTVLLILLAVATLRLDWLKVWWLDQWRHPPGTDDPDTNDIDPGQPATLAQRPQAHRVTRPAHAPHPSSQAHGAAALHRPALHRSGRRH
ncbi:hypothetical protein [Roseateles amylovorans]|uniref:Uncharacterized protein n=1 Tax=Roseateles amylovorans TaxID=2978473 RepID=A0ABY6AZX6_9BURK|nr:hypothetical protein [Roseateles amylovorans]UXH78458.1 hypothetical protein N4261_00500 [Roseateles amylovorans]